MNVRYCFILKINVSFLKYFILLLYPKVRFYVTEVPQKLRPTHKDSKDIDSLNKPAYSVVHIAATHRDNAVLGLPEGEEEGKERLHTR
jgi:hypothetical protein